MTEISENTSKRITSLRFLLMLFVMIKHNALVNGLFMAELPFDESKATTFIKEFFANGLGELAVPVFFIFSAYLFAMSEDTYFTKLRKRFYSIFVPYSIWTVFYFGAWIALKKFSIITGFVNPCMDLHEWTFRDYFLRFVGYNGIIHFPFVGSFWFLRDLMLLFLLSPVLLFFDKKNPFVFYF
ncbi:acyltransferase family protein [Treponema zioleckii]|uniref:acyltransferase family protein n=1 Tax=Treponema zioleckii TaxID=331680 RepID=UPI00168AB7BA|nr:acyltransferase family protein [Treponema zioleckii]